MVHHFSSRHQTWVKMAAMRLGAMLAVSVAVLMASGGLLANASCNTAKLTSTCKHQFEISGGKGGNVGNPQLAVPTLGGNHVSA